MRSSRNQINTSQSKKLEREKDPVDGEVYLQTHTYRRIACVLHQAEVDFAKYEQHRLKTVIN